MANLEDETHMLKVEIDARNQTISYYESKLMECTDALEHIKQQCSTTQEHSKTTSSQFCITGLCRKLENSLAPVLRELKTLQEIKGKVEAGNKMLPSTKPPTLTNQNMDPIFVQTQKDVLGRVRKESFETEASENFGMEKMNSNEKKIHLKLNIPSDNDSVSSVDPSEQCYKDGKKRRTHKFDAQHSSEEKEKEKLYKLCPKKQQYNKVKAQHDAQKHFSFEEEKQPLKCGHYNSQYMQEKPKHEDLKHTSDDEKKKHVNVGQTYYEYKQKKPKHGDQKDSSDDEAEMHLKCGQKKQQYKHDDDKMAGHSYYPDLCSNSDSEELTESVSTTSKGIQRRIH